MYSNFELLTVGHECLVEPNGYNFYCCTPFVTKLRLSITCLFFDHEREQTIVFIHRDSETKYNLMNTDVSFFRSIVSDLFDEYYFYFEVAGGVEC